MNEPILNYIHNYLKVGRNPDFFYVNNLLKYLVDTFIRFIFVENLKTNYYENHFY